VSGWSTRPLACCGKRNWSPRLTTIPGSALRTRTNPLTPEQLKRLRGVRPAGPPPRPTVEPIRVQRRASNTGIIMVVGQKIALGRLHRHRTVTVTVSDTTLAIDLGDGDVKVVRRTTTQAVRSIKGQQPRIAASGS
jgi:hypothetical protein